MVGKLSRPQGIPKFYKLVGQFDLEGQGYQFSNLSEVFNETVQSESKI